MLAPTPRLNEKAGERKELGAELPAQFLAQRRALPGTLGKTSSFINLMLLYHPEQKNVPTPRRGSAGQEAAEVAF